MRPIFYSVLFACVLLSAACSSSPKDMIIGKWKFDHVELTQSGDNKISDLEAALIQVKFKDVELQFFQDGTVQTKMDDVTKHGKFWLESDDTYLCTKYDNSEEEKRRQIIRIKSDTLVLGDETGGIVLVRTE